VAGARADWLPRALAADRVIVATDEADTPPVRVSERALRQILDVLIDNALTHGTGTVTLATRARPGAVEISVTDEGTTVLTTGVIFNRRSASAHGQGIGLALARSLTEAEGGRLNLLTGEPTTTFSLFFLTDEGL
jgi:signal transduction histidine kinase